jgi:hypothetical protein
MSDKILDETLTDFYNKYHYKIVKLHLKLYDYCNENCINVYNNVNSSFELYNFILENTQIINKMYENNLNANTNANTNVNTNYNENNHKFIYNDYIKILDNEILEDEYNQKK